MSIKIGDNNKIKKSTIIDNSDSTIKKTTKETFANSETKTITGSLVYKFADLFIVQWESMLDNYPDATFGGWIY